MENIQEFSDQSFKSVCQPRISRVNSKHKFTDEIWLISIINTVQNESFGSISLGHTKMIIEGLKCDQKSFFYKLYVGEFDIIVNVPDTKNIFTNIIGENLNVSEVRTKELEVNVSDISIEEYDKYRRDYSKCLSRQYYASPSDVLRMIDNIKKEKKLISDFNMGVEGALPIKFKLLPKQDGQEVNCSKWVVQHLSSIGIDVKPKKYKPKAVASESYMVEKNYRCLIS